MKPLLSTPPKYLRCCLVCHMADDSVVDNIDSSAVTVRKLRRLRCASCLGFCFIFKSKLSMPQGCHIVKSFFGGVLQFELPAFCPLTQTTCFSVYTMPSVPMMMRHLACPSFLIQLLNTRPSAGTSHRLHQLARAKTPERCSGKSRDWMPEKQ